MMHFLIKGLVRDKSRSRTPVIIVALGVMLTVFLHAYITGFMGDTIEMNANFSHGHVKIMTKAYADNMSQMPNDLALLDVNELIKSLEEKFPHYNWAPRIMFGGLVDAPDENGETTSQGPIMGMALDLFSNDCSEAERLKIRQSVVRGQIIQNMGQAILSEAFSQKMNLKPGDTFTIIGSTMEGSMSINNFTLAGTVFFGVDALDRGALIMDISDARNVLDMEDAAGEILGFFKNGYYDDENAVSIAKEFNSYYQDITDEYHPVMLSLSQQGSMGQYVEITKVWSLYISMVFVFAMALVLWNAGLLGSIRRYGEFGVRLAMGEEKSHVYKTLVYEAIFVGLMGSFIGTAFGILLAYLLQTYGIDISGMMEGASMMMPSVIKARITPVDFYIGFIPGLFSTILGAMLAGIAIYKRKTSQLFKELET